MIPTSTATNRSSGDSGAPCYHYDAGRVQGTCSIRRKQSLRSMASRHWQFPLACSASPVCGSNSHAAPAAGSRSPRTSAPTAMQLPPAKFNVGTNGSRIPACSRSLVTQSTSALRIVHRSATSCNPQMQPARQQARSLPEESQPWWQLEADGDGINCSARCTSGRTIQS